MTVFYVELFYRAVGGGGGGGRRVYIRTSSHAVGSYSLYKAHLLVVCTPRYLWLCTCTAHLVLSSKCSSTIAIACMQDHDIRAPPLFTFYSAAGCRSTALLLAMTIVLMAYSEQPLEI